MSNAILNANGGLDSARALSTAHDIMLNHGMKQPVLFHMILGGGKDIAAYQSAIKAIVRKLRIHGCRVEYFGAYEVAENRGGLHAHCFLLIETEKKLPFKILHVGDNEWLHKFAMKRNLKRIKLAQPQNPIHYSHGKQQFFARPVGDERLTDCLKWITYVYKSRSKEEVPGRETYFYSEFKANTVKQAVLKAKRKNSKPASIPLPAAPPAEQEQITIGADSKPLQGDNKPSEWIGIKLKPEPHQEAANSSQPYYNDKGTINEKHTTTTYRKVYQGEGKTGSSEGYYNGSGKASGIRYEDGSRTSTHYEGKGINLKLTPAQNYLSTVYERCVDAGMNLDAIRLHLAEQGIKRSPAQVVDELENTFGFLGYAARHPAPQKPDTRMLDALIDRIPLKAKGCPGSAHLSYKGGHLDPTGKGASHRAQPTTLHR